MQHSPELLEWKHQPQEEWRNQPHPLKNLDSHKEDKNDPCEGERVREEVVHCCMVPYAGNQYPTRCRQRCGTWGRDVVCHTAAIPQQRGASWARSDDQSETRQGSIQRRSRPQHDTRDSPDATPSMRKEKCVGIVVEGEPETRAGNSHTHHPKRDPPVAESGKRGEW